MQSVLIGSEYPVMDSFVSSERPMHLTCSMDYVMMIPDEV